MAEEKQFETAYFENQNRILKQLRARSRSVSVSHSASSTKPLDWPTNGAKTSDTRIVYLNVSGVTFQCSKTTLEVHKDSLLAMLVDDESPFKQNEDKDGNLHVFLEADPTHFRYILNWLRQADYTVLPSSKQILRELIVEVRLLNLTKMEDHIWRHLGFDFSTRAIMLESIIERIPASPARKVLTDYVTDWNSKMSIELRKRHLIYSDDESVDKFQYMAAMFQDLTVRCKFCHKNVAYKEAKASECVVKYHSQDPITTLPRYDVSSQLYTMKYGCCGQTYSGRDFKEARDKIEAKSHGCVLRKHIFLFESSFYDEYDAREKRYQQPVEIRGDMLGLLST